MSHVRMVCFFAGVGAASGATASAPLLLAARLLHLGGAAEAFCFLFLPLPAGGGTGTRPLLCASMLGPDFAGPAGWFSTTAGLAPAATASLAVRCLLAALCLSFLDGAGLLLLPLMSSLGARILTRPFAAAATFP